MIKMINVSEFFKFIL